MRTGQHHRPETLLAGMGAALTELVILTPAILAQEERPFQTPFLAPTHKLPNSGGFFCGAGLPEEYHLHTLRHFYATYLLQEGTSKQVAASLRGHADTAFLERTYCHPQDAVKLQAANLMQDLLNSQNPCYVAFMKNKNRKVKKAG